MILCIKSLDDAKKYMEQLKKFDLFTFTTGENEDFAVHSIRYCNDLFNVIYMHHDVKKDNHFDLNDDQCINFLYQHKEDINKSMLFNWKK
jgi:hypothetical protein